MPRLIGFPCFAASLLFVVCSTASSAQTVTLFGTGTPQTPIDPDTSAVTLGVKFYSTEAGTISGIRFYRAARNTSGYRVRLYRAGGSLMASASTTNEPCASVPCWEQINFAAPISIAANTTYIAAYYTSNGRYAGDINGLARGKTNTPLIAPASAQSGGNGVYVYANGFPNQTYKASNYWVDVVFTPSAPTLMMNFNPPNPKIMVNAPPGTAVSTVSVTWSNGAQFTGSITMPNSDGGKFSLSGNNVIINPTGPGIGGDAGTTQNVTVTATQ